MLHSVLRLFAKIPPIKLALRYWIAWQFKRFSEDPKNVALYPRELQSHAAKRKPISYYMRLLDKYIPEISKENHHV